MVVVVPVVLAAHRVVCDSGYDCLPVNKCTAKLTAMS